MNFNDPSPLITSSQFLPLFFTSAVLVLLKPFLSLISPDLINCLHLLPFDSSLYFHQQTMAHKPKPAHNTRTQPHSFFMYFLWLLWCYNCRTQKFQKRPYDLCSGLNDGPSKRYVHLQIPGICKCYLFQKRIFADLIK